MFRKVHQYPILCSPLCTLHFCNVLFVQMPVGLSKAFTLFVNHQMVHMCNVYVIHQVIVHEVPGQELEVEVYDKDPDQDDFLGRYFVSTTTIRGHCHV